MKTAARFPPPTPKKLPYQFIIKTILSYYVIDVTSQCAHLHIILNIQCVQNLFQWHSNMCSFACLYPVINIFLVWSSISWSAELKAVVEPQGDCFVCQLQVSRLAHFIIYWPETTSSVIIGYQPKNGTNSLHHGCSLVLLLLLLSPWYGASSPFYKTSSGAVPNSPKVTSNGPWQSSSGSSEELQVFPLVAAMTSPPSAPEWALASGFTHPGGLHQNDCTWARNWTPGGGCFILWPKAQHCSIVAIIW